MLDSVIVLVVKIGDSSILYVGYRMLVVIGIRVVL